MPRGETIESLLDPSLRVSRPVAACLRCRSAKIKCTWGTAACSACERSGKASSCTSANEEFARGNERSYTAALEAAVERLQRKIDAARAGQSLGLPSNASRRSSKGRKISGSQRKEASDVNELVSDFGFLTVNATSRDFQGFTSSMSFAKLVLAMAVKTDLSVPTAIKLPPRFTVMTSIELYFDSLYVLLPFFSETDFMTSISRVYQDAASSPVAPLDFWYIRLVLSISHASQCQTRGDEQDQQAFQHLCAAMQLAEYVIRPGSMAGVQALLLLVQYATLDPARLDCWYLIGMASRLVVDLGLHCEPSAETKISREALNMRRRVFHVTYTLDRLISMALERPFSFTDDSAPGVPLPEIGNDSGAIAGPELFLRSLAPSLYLFDIRRVQSAYYQSSRFAAHVEWSLSQASSYVQSSSKDVAAWHESIPSSLSAAHAVHFRLERLFTLILILAPHARHPLEHLPEVDKAMLFEYSVQYAELLHPVTYNNEHAPFFSIAHLQRTQWVGRQFIKILWSDLDGLLQAQHLLAGNVDATASSSMSTNCIRALNCIRQIAEIVSSASVKWGLPEIKEQFEKESAVLAMRLSKRLQDATPSPTFHNHQGQSYGFFDAGQYQAGMQDGHQRLSPGSTRRVYEFTGSTQK